MHHNPSENNDQTVSHKIYIDCIVNICNLYIIFVCQVSRSRCRLISSRCAMVDATDVVPLPLSDVAAEAVAPTELGDCENAKRQKRINYQPWEVAALVYTCHAACVAKPQSTIQYRSGYLREHYSRSLRSNA